MNDHDIQGPPANAARPRLLDLARETIRRRHYSYPHARLRLLDARKHRPSLGHSRGGDAPEFGGYLLLATQIAKTLQHDFRALLGVDNQR